MGNIGSHIGVASLETHFRDFAIDLSGVFTTLSVPHEDDRHRASLKDDDDNNYEQRWREMQARTTLSGTISHEAMRYSIVSARCF